MVWSYNYVSETHGADLKFLTSPQRNPDREQVSAMIARRFALGYVSEASSTFCGVESASASPNAACEGSMGLLPCIMSNSGLWC